MTNMNAPPWIAAASLFLFLQPALVTDVAALIAIKAYVDPSTYYSAVIVPPSFHASNLMYQRHGPKCRSGQPAS